MKHWARLRVALVMPAMLLVGGVVLLLGMVVTGLCLVMAGLQRLAGMKA